MRSSLIVSLNEFPLRCIGSEKYYYAAISIFNRSEMDHLRGDCLW